MQRTYYFTDQDVLAEDLNNTEDTKITQIKRYAQYPLGDSGGYHGNDPTVSASVTRGGIYGQALNYDSGFVEAGDKDLQIIKNSATELEMNPGAALDENGELIIVAATKTMSFGGSDSNYTWVLPGGPYGIQQYYVKLKYLETSGSIKANDVGVSYPTRYTGSYFVTINSAPKTSGEILLATFMGDTSAHVTGSVKDQRLFIRPITPADAVMLDPYNKPVSAWSTVEDHVNAVGSGTPTDTNPHGLTGDDIGLTDTTAPHRKEAHSPGIVDVTGAYPNTTAFKNSYLPTFYDEGANAGILWTAPDTNAYIMVKGALYKPTLDTVDFTTHPDVVAGGYDRYYTFYYEGSGSVVRATGSVVVPYENDGYRTYDWFILCRAYISDGGSAYSDTKDYRRFHTTRTDNIRGEYQESTNETAYWYTLDNQSTLFHNLARIRYRLALALNGSDWAGDNPLTQGAVSDASSYHYHMTSPFHIYTNNNQILLNPSIFIKRYTGVLDGFMYHGGTNRAYMLKAYSGGGVPSNSQVADLVVGSLYVQSNQLTSAHVAAMPTLTGGSSSNADAYHTHSSTANPSSGSVVPYVENHTHRNPFTGPMFVSAWAREEGTSEISFGLWLAPVSGSELSNNAVQRVSIATGDEGCVFAVVPPGWYFKLGKITGSGNVGDLYVYTYPSGSIDYDAPGGPPD